MTDINITIKTTYEWYETQYEGCKWSNPPIINYILF